MLATIMGKLPVSAIAMLVVASTILYGGIVVCIVVAIKRKP